jgi:hypothetical protein
MSEYVFHLPSFDYPNNIHSILTLVGDPYKRYVLTGITKPYRYSKRHWLDNLAHVI